MRNLCDYCNECDYINSPLSICFEVCGNPIDILAGIEEDRKSGVIVLKFRSGTVKYAAGDYVLYEKRWLKEHFEEEMQHMKEYFNL